jgi:hypothetical protein
MPVTGDINVTIYRADRQLWTGEAVNLRLMDPFSDTEKVLVNYDTNPGTPSVLLNGAPADKGQNYIIFATANGHRDAGIFPVQPIPGGVRHAAVMLVPENPVPDFSHFSYEQLNERSPRFKEALEAGGITQEVFLGLAPDGDKRIAGALNLEAKLRSTMLAGKAAVEFVKTIDGESGINQDRILGRVDANMPDRVRSEINASHNFIELLEWENEIFHSGYPVSFKQRVPFGSLQLSFAKEASGDLLAADMDIDLYTDVGHFGEVIRNHVTQQKTDPFTVYVQLFDQRIFPLYLLKASAEE